MEALRRTGAALVGAVLTAFFVAGKPALAQHQSDSAFAELQLRGRGVMGVDQYTSTHRFDDLPDGGRIELQYDRSDSSAVRTIREHLAKTTRSFTAGDFTAPGLVHAGNVPGADTMRARRDRIRYEFRPLKLGGEIRIVSRDPASVQAIHSFLAFQRREHRAGGTEHSN